MSTVDEYHKYARDCLRWAARARTEEQRQRFLSLAHDWTQAAFGLEGVPFPSELSNRGVNEATAAKAVGLSGPDTVLARADVIIE
jgi:hypothetical protein